MYIWQHRVFNIDCNKAFKTSAFAIKISLHHWHVKRKIKYQCSLNLRTGLLAQQAIRVGTLWRYQIETIFRVASPLWGESTCLQWIPFTTACDTKLWYFYWPASEHMVEQSRGRWYETPSHSLWHHCNEIKAVLIYCSLRSRSANGFLMPKINLKAYTMQRFHFRRWIAGEITGSSTGRHEKGMRIAIVSVTLITISKYNSTFIHNLKDSYMLFTKWCSLISSNCFPVYHIGPEMSHLIVI